MNEIELFDNVRRLYSECSEYADTGLLKSSDKLDREFSEFSLGFSTRFKRNKSFRFKWTDLGAINEVVDDKRGVRVILHGKQQKATDLNAAFAKASGITCGVTHNIPSLLFDDIRGRGLRQLSEVSVEDCVVEQRSCFKISGKLICAKDTIIWIDADFHIVRIESYTAQSRDEVRKGREIASAIFTNMGKAHAAQYLLSAPARPSERVVTFEYQKVKIIPRATS